MSRTRMMPKNGKTTSKGKSASARRNFRKVPIPPRRSGLSEISGEVGAASPAIFGNVFSSYWQAVQEGQSTVLATSQEAYGTLLKAFQTAWEENAAQTSFVEACRRFATRAGNLGEAADAETVGDLYREYVEELQEVWSQPNLMKALEEASLTYSETVQKTIDDAQQKVAEESKRYFLALKDACVRVPIESLDTETLTAISRNMMVTVFFTEGVRSESV